MAAEPIRRVFVIGMGEVGRRLAGALERSGVDVRPVTREAGWAEALDEADPSPRLLAMREEDLGAALERFPDSLRGHLVLVQNGFLEAVLGDLGPVTRGLIYFTSKGDFFRVLCASPFHGPHAAAIGRSVDAGGILAAVEHDRAKFVRSMIVKGIWNAIVGLPLSVHGVDLATYLRDHRGELEALAEESARAASAEYGIDLGGAEAVRKIRETTSGLGWVRGGAKALAWRNGAIVRFGRRHGIPTPVNDGLLRAVGHDPDGRGPESRV